jgi:hypothetical protein
MEVAEIVTTPSLAPTPLVTTVPSVSHTFSRYTDPITIVLKFYRGLNVTTQDRIAKSGIDQPKDNDFNTWFKAACRSQLPGK